MSRSLFAEMKRRNVFKAGVAYLALGWVVTQVTSTVAPAFNLPGWIVPVVIWIGVIGFPFVIAFSWIYEITPKGLKRESEVDRSASITHVTGRRMDYLIVGLLVLAIGFTAFDRFGPHRSGTGASSDATATSAVPAAAPAAPAVSDNSIAVLPFVNMSSDKEQEYFSDGLSEELLNLLAQVPQLRVIARTSSFAFRGKEVGVTDIAKALNVANVLEGSVRKSGETLRITAQLIRTADSSHLWSETYDRKLTDVFKVQDEIASAVVAQLKVKLLPAQQVTNPHRTANTEAYNQYLLGNQYYSRNSRDGDRLAVAAYQKAVELDPEFAAAYAGLGVAEMYASDYADSLEENAAAKQRAQANIDKAIALAPDLADGYAARGWQRATLLRDFSGSQEDFEKALALEPGNALVLRRYGLLQNNLGRAAQAIAAYRRAIELDPLSSSAWSNLASAYFLDPSQFRQAREALDRSLAINPESSFALAALATLELLEGHAQDALSVSGRAGEVFRQWGVAMAQHTLGNAGESQRALDELIAKYAHDSAFQIAEVYAWRGEADKAFEWLERAYVQHDGGLAFIKPDPLFRGLHTDPRYAAMLKKLGLPPQSG
ncbi:MAG TPA: tetratricopeptide repeat protein [Rhodanobacteraceae bacterium]|nr:tetratricopeptide repeat protein [Rhodanobacteraceae bacterium]